MNNKKTLLLVSLIILALVQLYVPGSMIYEREVILKEGTEYKFKTAPIDPNDPFRGKYINLRFEQNSIKVADANNWKRSEDIFTILSIDSLGFAYPKSISKVEPNDGEIYIASQVNFIQKKSNELFIDYPFDRFYMDEFKAYEAGQTYRKSQEDQDKTTYALVSIKDGNAVLKDVLIDGVSIREIVKSNQLKSKN